MATTHSDGCGDHSPKGVMASIKCPTRSSEPLPTGTNAESTAVGGIFSP